MRAYGREEDGGAQQIFFDNHTQAQLRYTVVYNFQEKIVSCRFPRERYRKRSQGW